MDIDINFCDNNPVNSGEDSDNSELADKKFQQETLPWIEKYRPASMDEIISQERIISTLRVFIKNECLPHLLFYGPPGTGKTSTISACAKELYGEYYHFMVMELNASDDRGIEAVRTKIKQFVSADSIFFGETSNGKKKDMFKLVILDETDAMTEDAQAILRKVVEKYTFNTRFCLICNYIQKINPALQSRCAPFRFSPLGDSQIRKKVISISKRENVKITKSGMDTLLKRSHGDMRKILNILQSVSMSYSVVNEKNINNRIGYPQKPVIITMLNMLINDSFIDATANISNVKNIEGLSLSDIIKEIHDIIVHYIMTDDKCDTDIDKLSIEQLKNILSRLRDIEYNQSINSVEDIQLGALIGIFNFL